MKNLIISLSVLFITCFLSLVPPINLIINNPPLEAWLWLVLIAGFFGVFILFIETNWEVKAIALLAFLNCFFSAIPYLSFSSYIMVIVTCYFYILCTKVQDWTLIFKAIQSVCILNILVVAMQCVGHDPLLNFGVFQMENYGIMGQHMQMASFMVVIGALLVNFNKLNILPVLVMSLLCHSSWAFLSVMIGAALYIFHSSIKWATLIFLGMCVIFVVWAIKDHKFTENLDGDSGRSKIWQRSIELTNQRPWTGWGLGSFKDIFPSISRLNCEPWRNAHNFIIQLVFEVGYPLTICLLFALGCLALALYKANLWLPLAGLSAIAFDALMHFPDRMMQCVPLMIVFLAYCQFKLRRAVYGIY